MACNNTENLIFTSKAQDIKKKKNELLLGKTIKTSIIKYITFYLMERGETSIPKKQDMENIK